MKYSRPLLAFDAGFGEREELKLLKCLFTDVFGTPRCYPKSKLFMDQVMGCYYVEEIGTLYRFELCLFPLLLDFVGVLYVLCCVSYVSWVEIYD